MRTLIKASEWRRDARGAAAVEFALVYPSFLLLMVGGVFGCALLYSNMSLQAAVQRAARCYSVNATTCGSPTAIQTYALSQYYGISTPTFTASIQPCGHQVIGSTTINFPTPGGKAAMPLSATSCFP
jgi:Flp pilus assembly protein TadG